MPIDLRVTMTVPKLELRMNREELLREVGEAIVRQARENATAGRNPDGGTLPRPKAGGTPLRATGQLVGSLTYEARERGGVVLPTCVREETRRYQVRGSKYSAKQRRRITSPKRRGHMPNAAVAAILAQPGRGKHGGGRPPYALLDPEGRTMTEAMQREIDRVLRAELVATGETTVTGETGG